MRAPDAGQAGYEGRVWTRGESVRRRAPWAATTRAPERRRHLCAACSTVYFRAARRLKGEYRGNSCRTQPALASSAGSGFYELLENAREVAIETPFGAPSDSYFLGEIGGVRVAFLPRHARGHRILPGEVNYRANIWGMKALGVHSVLSRQRRRQPARGARARSTWSCPTSSSTAPRRGPARSSATASSSTWVSPTRSART